MGSGGASAANVPVDDRELKGIRDDGFNHSVDCGDELTAQSGRFLFVPVPRADEFLPGSLSERDRMHED